MKYKVIEQWRPNGGELCILYLDKEKTITTASEDYRFFQIGGVSYKPVAMIHGNGKCIAINGKGNFIGKEVEFLKEEQ